MDVLGQHDAHAGLPPQRALAYPLPRPGAEGDHVPETETVDAYNLVRWSEGGFSLPPVVGPRAVRTQGLVADYWGM